MEIEEIFKELNEALNNFDKSHKLFEEIEQIKNDNNGVLTIVLLDNTKVSGRVKDIKHIASFDKNKMSIIIYIDVDNKISSYDLSQIKKLY